jgi:hypothetical protein
VYSSIIVNINDIDIMVTLNNVYFGYIKILCRIFAKYIVPILQVYPNNLIILLKIITNDIYYYLYHIFILITCNKKLNFNITFDYNLKIVISYYIMIIIMMMIILE